MSIFKQSTTKLILMFHLLLGFGFSQFLVDGEFSDPGYQLLGSKLNGNIGFGPDVDITKIYYGMDGDNLYLGFECSIQNSPNTYNPKPDGLGIMLNFSSESGALPETPLGFHTFYDYHFINGGLEDWWQNEFFKADFEVDYLLAVYSDGTPNVAILDCATHVPGKPDSVQSIGATDQAGTSISGPYMDGVFSYESIGFAYQNSTGSGSLLGAEIKIPFSEFNGAAYDQFQLFTAMLAGTAYFSNVTLPGNVFSGNQGANPNYYTNHNDINCGCPLPNAVIGVGPYHTNMVHLGESRPVLEIHPSDSINFGIQYVGLVDSVEIEIKNRGIETLVVDDIQLDGVGFSAITDTFSLQPGESRYFSLIFSPLIPQLYTGTLDVFSNDSTTGTISIELLGDAQYPPDISVSPDSLHLTVFPGAVSHHAFVIDNLLEESTLNWEAYLTPDASEAVVYFSKQDYADWNLPENQDRISDNVWITRASNQGIFNSAVETGYNGDSPEDTEWAYGYTEDLSPADYDTWRPAVDYNPPGMLDQPISLHLITDDVYLDVQFLSWTSGSNGGGFSYTRSAVKPSWLSLDREDGSLLGIESDTLVLTLDATGLETGLQLANLIILSNDPDEERIIIPLEVDVLPGSDIYIEHDTLDFGNVYLGFSDTLLLPIHNLGSETLMITDITADMSGVDLSSTSVDIFPGESFTLLVSLTPTATGEYSGTIAFSSSDPDENVSSIILLGSSIEPPVAGVTPDSLGAELFTDETIIQSMSISNTGSSDLTYEVKSVSINREDLSRYINPNHLFSGPRISRDDFMDLSRLWYMNSQSNGSRRGKAGPRSNEDASESSLREIRESWGWLYTDPQENSETDISNVYGMTASDELHLKIEGYTEFNDMLVGIYIDADQDINTGLDTEQDGLGWFLGIDYVIISTGMDFDGLFIWDGFEDGFIFYDSLSTNIVEENSNERIVGVDLDHFEGVSAINFAIIAESFEEGEDETPDFGAGHITFPLSAPWLAFEPESGVISAGGQQNVSVTFDATDMFGGEYYAQISVLSNDPGSPEISTLAYLNVTGIPDVSVGEESIQFGDVFVDYAYNMELEIASIGTDSLLISSISIDNPAYTLSHTSLNLAHSQVINLGITVNPTEATTYDGTLSIISNDPDQASITIPVHAVGLIAPIIMLDTDIVNVEWDQDEVLNDTVMIINDGGSDLIYSISIQTPGFGREEGGPDAFGYSWKDSDDPAGPEFNWVDISAGNEIFLSDDSYASDIPIGFPFGYYGSVFENVNIMSNGWLSFVSDEFWYPDVVPYYSEFEYQGAIVPFGGDLYPEFGDVYYDTRGSAPNRQFIVQYDHVSWCCSGPPYMTFQVVLYEQGGGILFQYQDLENSWPQSVGISNDNNSIGLGNGGIDGTYINPEMIRDNYSILFSTRPEWLSLEPLSGTIAAGMSRLLVLQTDATELENGQYAANVVVRSNDPETPETNIGVLLNVIVAGAEDRALLPESFVLNQNYPNPFNPISNIRYGLPDDAEVTLMIYDIAGRLVNTVVKSRQSAGWHQVEWNGTNSHGQPLGTGVYFCRLVAGDYSHTIKMVYLK